MRCYDAMRRLPDRSRSVSDDLCAGRCRKCTPAPTAPIFAALAACIQPPCRTSCRVGRLALCCATCWRMVGMRSFCDDNHVAIFSRVNLAPSSKHGRPARHGYPPSRAPPPRQLDKRITTRDARGCATLLGCGASQIALDAFPTPSRCLGSSQRRLLATPPSSLHTAHHMLSSGPRRQPVATWMPCIAFAPHAHVRARRCAASVGGSIEC